MFHRTCLTTAIATTLTLGTGAGLATTATAGSLVIDDFENVPLLNVPSMDPGAPDNVDYAAPLFPANVSITAPSGFGGNVMPGGSGEANLSANTDATPRFSFLYESETGPVDLSGYRAFTLDVFDLEDTEIDAQPRFELSFNGGAPVAKAMETAGQIYWDADLFGDLSAVDAILLEVITIQANESDFAIDNLQALPVPTPAAGALGLIGFGLVGLRRRVR